MTLGEIIDNISLSGFPIDLHLSVKRGDIIPGSVKRQEHLVIELKAKSRDDQEKPWLTATEIPVPGWVYESMRREDADPPLEWIHDGVERVVTHELAEQFLYKGKRVFDPHTRDEA